MKGLAKEKRDKKRPKKNKITERAEQKFCPF
jgi:hypothetical protein